MNRIVLSCASPLIDNRNRLLSLFAALINLATDAIVDLAGHHSTDQYVHSILQCHVALDRMEQSAIDQLMQDPADAHSERINTTVGFAFRGDLFV